MSCDEIEKREGHALTSVRGRAGQISQTVILSFSVIYWYIDWYNRAAVYLRRHTILKDGKEKGFRLRGTRTRSVCNVELNFRSSLENRDRSLIFPIPKQ